MVVKVTSGGGYFLRQSFKGGTGAGYCTAVGGHQIGKTFVSGKKDFSELAL